MKNIKTSLEMLFRAFRNIFISTDRYYEDLGIDFILDKDHAYVIEANVNPGKATFGDKHMIPDMLDIVT